MLNPTNTTATAPVAPEIIPALPPINAVIIPRIKAVYSPTKGETPAIIENAIASGTKATATTIPERISLFALCPINVSFIFNKILAFYLKRDYSEMLLNIHSLFSFVISL